MRLLVVDDDSPSRYLLESVFSARGHQVDSAADGRDALDKARLNPPDMVITDILMPRMDGYRLCIEWHEDARLSGIPFVFYTATYVEDADESFALTLGADAFLRKPMDSPSLVHAIEDIQRSRRPGRRSGRAKASDETGVLREYNDRLVSKLEKKVAHLQAANAELRTAIELLTDEVGVKDTLIRRLNEELAARESTR
ncbi:MAG: response regulator [Actinobacteria bacterium]|nr:MAG: response regulator [Actinomycetota bacterium]